jgi:hypothetical protein
MNFNRYSAYARVHELEQLVEMLLGEIWNFGCLG